MDGFIRMDPTYPYCIADEFIMPIEIETGVSIPAKKTNHKAFLESEEYKAFLALEIGQSFFIACSEEDRQRTQARLSGLSKKYFKDRLFLSRSYKGEQSGVRFWRVEA